MTLMPKTTADQLDDKRQPKIHVVRREAQPKAQRGNHIFNRPRRVKLSRSQSTVPFGEARIAIGVLGVRYRVRPRPTCVVDHLLCIRLNICASNAVTRLR